MFCWSLRLIVLDLTVLLLHCDVDFLRGQKEKFIEVMNQTSETVSKERLF